MIVDPSKFDRYIAILKPTESNSSESGERSITYALEKNVWAHIDTRSMNEQFVADKRASSTSIVLNIRQDSSMTLTNKWRLTLEAKTYQITGVVENTNFPRGEVWRVTAEINE
jgi:SPP1 family predicted phage head-tail adaptor